MTGRIFLSYRRSDEPGFALALFGRLEQSFPPERLFMDVEGGIAAGEDFVQVLADQVNACDVMLVLIGPKWLSATDEVGRRRLDDPQDFVRIEIDSALRLRKRVIPVLVNKTEMPRAKALPEPLKPLARRNAVGLTRERFKADAHGLIKAVQGALAEAEAARQRAATEAAAAPLEAIVGLPPEDITKAEELTNWDFIKASENSQEFRDHLARFPAGITERMARTKLEDLAWDALVQPLDIPSLNAFLDEFPSGAHAEEAKAKLAELEGRKSTDHHTARL
jgi:TIR domain